MARFKRSTKIQTIIVKRYPGLSQGKASSMVKGAGFGVFKVDVKPHQYRFRQESPMHFNPKTFRTISLKPGSISAVVGVPKLQYY